MEDDCWVFAGGEGSFSEHIHCELVLGIGRSMRYKEEGDDLA